MNCIYYREQVSAFVDNELDPGSQTQLFDHLANCSECHLFLDSMMKFKSMKHQEELEFPAEVDGHLFEEINRRKFVYKLGKNGIQVKLPFWQRRVALPVPTLTVMIAALLIGGSTLFMNLLTQGSGSKNQSIQNALEEKKVETREIIVYGVSGVTVYGRSGTSQKTGL